VKYTAGLRTGAVYGVDFAVQMAVCIPLVLLVSGVFYLLLEKPCMNKYWPKHLLEFFKPNKL
jgi:peptidoglycan/LPS O-acetylase OafA/YrhL